MNASEIFLVLVVTVMGMELFAWAAHKYIMHGWGWGWHRDHHEPHTGLLERNDLYAAAFSVIATALFMADALWSPLLWWIDRDHHLRTHLRVCARWAGASAFHALGPTQMLCQAVGAGAQASSRDRGEAEWGVVWLLVCRGARKSEGLVASAGGR